MEVFGHPTAFMLLPTTYHFVFLSIGCSSYLNHKRKLGGGFKYFLLSPLLGEDFQFDYYFSDGLVQPPTRKVSIFVDLLGLPPDLAASRSQSHLCGEVSLQRAQRWSAQKQGSQCHGTGLVQVAEEVKKNICWKRNQNQQRWTPTWGPYKWPYQRNALCFFCGVLRTYTAPPFHPI